MKRIAAGYVAGAAAALVLSAAVCWSAPKRKSAPPPVPRQILSVKRIFISNGGGSCRGSTYGQSPFSGGPNRAYNQFYSGMAAWGHYKLATSPAAAVLDFKIQFSCPTLGVYDAGVTEYDAQFRLAITDIQTHVLLWVITEHVEWALLAGNRNRNFDRGMTRLLDDLNALVSKPAKGSP